MAGVYVHLNPAGGILAEASFLEELDGGFPGDVGLLDPDRLVHQSVQEGLVSDP